MISVKPQGRTKNHRCLKSTKKNLTKIYKWYLNSYVDADIGSNEETKKSITGFIINMGQTPISWYSKFEHCISKSTGQKWILI